MVFGRMADGEVGTDAEDLAEVARGDVVAGGDEEGGKEAALTVKAFSQRTGLPAER